MAVRHYTLLATDGYINLASKADASHKTIERQKVYAFGFCGGLFKLDDTVINAKLDPGNPANMSYWQTLKGKASIPSPLIWAEQGDRVYVTLINLGMLQLPERNNLHTVHILGGQVSSASGAFPLTSSGVPVWDDTQLPPPQATYFLQPDQPGTYVYHCFAEASEHIQMGMYGALVVYPSSASLLDAGIYQSPLTARWFVNGTPQRQIPLSATNRNFAYNDIQSYFAKEYVLLLSEIDTAWHESIEHNSPFNAANYKPNYWLINGRSFPDTLLPQPITTPDSGSHQITYESYPHGQAGQNMLLRVLNMGYHSVPWYVHGGYFTLIGKDAKPNPWLKLVRHLGLSGEEFVSTHS
ncbi:MAG: multicopper oxidase domain-containing protein, partial [Peptococcaceae bacterium]|nr:multicopper oxidase domain-containing protein [Peptococcaceae bacterium]